MKISRLGFSLVELMVVIAIVAVLAAIALPAYHRYVASAKIFNIARIFESYVDQSIKFGQTHGHYGQSHDVGLGQRLQGYADDTIASQVLQGAYLPYNEGGGWNMWDDTRFPYIANGACGQYGVAWVCLKPSALGIDPNLTEDSDCATGLQCYWWHTEGTIRKVCSYWYGTNANGSNTGNLIPGWINQNNTNAWEGNNLSPYVSGNPSYQAATCLE